ncbi:MAG: type II toxin-antitoxin system death-on-curing family toxin [Alphaproteobacteria bacterium PRO2]|nr:type II toxin-antitoxin system death-on-curing family toxin [Alphaproteobacteria bacterium PRO2]
MISNNYAYFDIRYALITHKTVIEQSGGLAGVKNQGYLESVLDHIQNDGYYPELVDKITHLVHSVIKIHAFNDGNKRAGIALGSYFLELNGHDYSVLKFTAEMENIVVWVAENKIDKDLLKELIESILYEDDYSEELKLKLISAISN